MTLLILESLLILVLVCLNGALAMSEIAIVSARRPRLKERADRGDRGAAAALALAAEPTAFLSTVQIGITFVGILAGAFGGATIAEALGARLRAVPALAPYAESVAVGLVVLVIGVLSLVLGELVPKRIALTRPERIAAAAARPLQVLSFTMAPAVRLLGLAGDAVLRLLRVPAERDAGMSEEELRIVIRQGTQAGLLESREQAMLESVLRLGDRKVGLLMTPRRDLVYLRTTDSLAEIQRKIAASPHAGFPVSTGDADAIIGVVHARDLLPRALAREPIDLQGACRPPVFVPESMNGLEVLEVFRKSAMPMGLVIDEHGVFQGVVTPTDVFEAIVGEMNAASTPSAVRRDDGSFLLDGMLPVDELKELLGIGGDLPDEGTYQTLGGFVLQRMGHVPKPGQSFEWSGLRFEVMDMDLMRVDKVLVSGSLRPRPRGL